MRKRLLILLFLMPSLAGYSQINFFRTHTNSISLADVTTTEATKITSSQAMSGGNVLLDNGSAVTNKGVCWSTNVNPTTANSHTSDGSGTGAFVSTISGLSPSTLYYVRAYAINGAGTAYGNNETFTTSEAGGELAWVSTSAISSITDVSAAGGGYIAYKGSSDVTARGVCWSTSWNPTTSDSHTSEACPGDGTGSFSSSITGLSPCTYYNVRAYATNSYGTSYGSNVSFRTTNESKYDTQFSLHYAGNDGSGFVVFRNSLALAQYYCHQYYEGGCSLSGAPYISENDCAVGDYVYHYNSPCMLAADGYYLYVEDFPGSGQWIVNIVNHIVVSVDYCD